MERRSPSSSRLMPSKRESATDSLAIRVKTEPEAEFKDYAETTMNELLGWYGYDKVVDSKDTRDLDLHRFAPDNPHPPDSARSQNSMAQRSPPQAPPTSGPSSSVPPSPGCPDSPTPLNLRYDSSPGGSTTTTDERPSKPLGNEGGRIGGSSHSISAMIGDSSPEPADNDNDDQEPIAEHSPKTGMVSEEDEDEEADGMPKQRIVCAWCLKPGLKLFTLKMPSGSTKAFCGELCFTLCRRASFKKNKVCDWCKEVGNTVNYVDLQDGDQQLQFCGSKCLNQYKMGIFCKETQEHLQQLQTQVDGGSLPPASSAILITPELWLERNSRKRTSSAAGVGSHTSETATKSSHSDDLTSSPSPASEPVTATSSRDPADWRHKESTDMASSRAHAMPAALSIDKMLGRHHHASEGRPRKHKPRETFTSTPLSVVTSPPSHNATSRGGHYHVSSATSRPHSSTSIPTSLAAAAAAASAAASGAHMPHPLLGGLPPASNPLLYHPMFAAGMPGMPGMPGFTAAMQPAPALPPAGLGSLTPRLQPKEERTQSTSSISNTSAQPSPTHPPPSHPPPGLQHMNPSIQGLLGASNFPQFLAGPLPGYPANMVPPMPHQMQSMLPPNTLIVPCPIPIPIPVPIPIPIPIPMYGKLDNISPMVHIKEERADSAPCPRPPLSGSISVGRGHVRSESAGPRDECGSPASGSHSPAGDGLIRCTCCQPAGGDCTTSHSAPLSHSPDAPVAPKRRSLSDGDTSPGVHMSRAWAVAAAEEQDNAIDLSKDASPRKQSLHRHTCSPTVAPVRRHVKHGSGISRENLAARFPHPSAAPGSTYSSRRSLILDAPNVPKDRKRSPTPERRSYGTYRGHMYIKRRCIRPRIKSK